MNSTNNEKLVSRRITEVFDSVNIYYNWDSKL